MSHTRMIRLLTLALVTAVTTVAFSPAAFLTTRQAHHRKVGTKLASTTTGQGGGIFYDGASEFNTPQQQSSNFQPSSSPSPSSAINKMSSSMKRTQTKDVVIIGGGLAGLAAALYTSQMAPDRHVTIVEREPHNENKATTVASFAAAGMLAPQSERLPKGPLLDLCCASRRLYPEFCDLVETLAQDPEGAPYLFSNQDDDDEKQPWSVGYVASGGFLAPAFAGDAVATWAPPEDAGSATWLDVHQVRELEPNLHPDVVGGWWFPEDASVDARRLTCSLRAACVTAGVHFLHGPSYEVTSLDLVDGTCRGLWLKNGRYIATKSVLVANGAWMRNLLPVPIEPHKGQSLSLRMPPDRPPLLQRVLFAQDSYIVPKADGRIVIGATVEAGSYDPHVTPAGIIHCLSHALQLVPGLADLPLEETWVGLRPTTPDKGPILGKTPWNNLYLAGGYWRNGVLLAPKTGQLLASLLCDLPLQEQDAALLDAFSWNRFTSPEGGATLAANARYAASMHPIHKRTSGSGVSAAVGTELGFYSDATTAAEERQKDRSALWGDESSDDAFERAAQLGKQDAVAFNHGDEEKDEQTTASSTNEAVPLQEDTQLEATPDSSKTNHYLASLQTSVTSSFHGSQGAITVGSTTLERTSSFSPSQEQQQQHEDDEGGDLTDIYQQIQDSQASRDIVMSESTTPDEKPDPGFRIYREDPVTGELRMVPPYTSPEEFEQMLANEKKGEKTTKETVPSSSSPSSLPPPPAAEEDTGGSDSIFDGYKAIEEAHEGVTPEELAKSQREVRMKNRADMTTGGLNLDEDSFPSFDTTPVEETAKDQEPQQQEGIALEPQSTIETTTTTTTNNNNNNVENDQKNPLDVYPNLKSVYERIRSNKASQTPIEMSEEAEQEERPDPGFRIYREDPDTGELWMVPPYTSPEEFEQMMVAEKQQQRQKQEGSSQVETPAAVGDSLSSPNNHDKEAPPPSDSTTNSPTLPTNGQDEEYNEQTYDGYTVIQQANSRGSREEELEAMREARRKNRIGTTEIDESIIGAQHVDDE